MGLVGTLSQAARWIGRAGGTIVLAAAVACSKQPPGFDPIEGCGSAGKCPAGTICVSHPRGAAAPLCCPDSSCSGLFLSKPDADPPRRSSDATAPDAGISPPADADGVVSSLPPPDADVPADLIAVVDRPADVIIADPADAAPLDPARLGDGGLTDPASMSIDTAPLEPAPHDDSALAQGCRAYLRFDDVGPDQGFHDGSGNGNVAMWRGSDAMVPLAVGRYDGGVKLAGDGWLEMAASPSFNTIAQRLSVAAWIFRAAGETGDGTIVSRRSASGAGQLFVLEIAADHLRARINTASGYNANLTSSSALGHDRWTHVAMTYDGQVVRLFVDGAERGSMPYALGLPPELSPVLVGAAEPGAGGSPISRLTATIDEVLLYDRALGSGECVALAARSRPTAK
jgi:hypothetical protein